MWVITGRVTDEHGHPVAGVRVTAALPVNGSMPAPILTDASGDYRFDDLRPGTYRVTFSRAGFHSIVHPNVAMRNPYVAILNVTVRRVVACLLQTPATPRVS